MRTSARITLNTISRWLGLLISIFVGIVIVPIMLDQFGKDGYGLIGICGSLLALRIMMDFGLRAAITRELSAAGAAGDREHYNRFFNTGLAVYLLLGIISAFACAVFAPIIIKVLNVAPAFYDEGAFLIRFYAGPLFFLVFATAPMASVITSNDRFDLLNYIEAAMQILRSIGVLLVLTITPWGLYGYAIAEVLAYTVNLGLVILTARGVRPSLRFDLRQAQLRALPLRTSSHIFLLTVSEQLSLTADNFILSSFMGSAAVGLYVPGRLLSRRLRPVIDAVKDQLHPLATARFSQGRTGQLQSILFQGTKYRLLMGIGACVGLGIFAPHLVQVWLGESLPSEDLQTVALVMSLWAATDLWTYAGGSQWPVLFGMKEFPFLVRLSLPLAILNIVASILLVGFTEIGLIGVVIPTLCTETCRVLITFFYCCRCLQLSALKYFRESYLRPLTVLVVLTVIALAIRRIFVPNDMASLFTCAIIGASAWAMLCWWFGMRPFEREQILTLIHTAANKLPFIQRRVNSTSVD
jgi:O-antigen/teichoic acid export membrane protein